jgi:hypothetical protein
MGSNNTGCEGIDIYNCGGEGISHNGSGDLCNKDKGRGNGQDLLKD